MITQKQADYLCMYQSGFTMEEIAKRYGVNKSTVCRTLARAKRHKCPFSTDCTKCPLPDCAIKEEYAYMMNNMEDRQKKR